MQLENEDLIRDLPPVGWTAWYGGQNPFSEPTHLRLIRRDGRHTERNSHDAIWEHTGKHYDIMCYRTA